MILTGAQQKMALDVTLSIRASKGEAVLVRLPIGCERALVIAAVMRNFSNPVYVSSFLALRRQIEDVSEALGRKLPTRSPDSDLFSFDLVVLAEDMYVRGLRPEPRWS